MKNFNDESFNKSPMWIQLLVLPFMYIVMICKILITIPMFIIAKCNKFLNKL